MMEELIKRDIPVFTSLNVANILDEDPIGK